MPRTVDRARINRLSRRRRKIPGNKTVLNCHMLRCVQRYFANPQIPRISFSLLQYNCVWLSVVLLQTRGPCIFFSHFRLDLYVWIFDFLSCMRLKPTGVENPFTVLVNGSNRVGKHLFHFEGSFFFPFFKNGIEFDFIRPRSIVILNNPDKMVTRAAHGDASCNSLMQLSCTAQCKRACTEAITINDIEPSHANINLTRNIPTIFLLLYQHKYAMLTSEKQ